MQRTLPLSATHTVQSMEMMENFQTQNDTFRKQSTLSIGFLKQIILNDALLLQRKNQQKKNWLIVKFGSCINGQINMDQNNGRNGDKTWQDVHIIYVS